MYKPSVMDDEDLEGQTLQELIDAMGQMSAQKLPKKSPDVSITIAAGHDGKRDESDEGLDIPDGMDPRLAELIRKKKAGAC